MWPQWNTITASAEDLSALLERLGLSLLCTIYSSNYTLHTCLYQPLRTQRILNADRHSQPARQEGYTLSCYHSAHSLHHSALDSSINLQHCFSSLFFLSVHRVHPNQVQQSSRCCLHVGWNTACWPSGWRQTWRCAMGPLGAVVWLEQ